jgi:hypothetical protein
MHPALMIASVLSEFAYIAPPPSSYIRFAGLTGHTESGDSSTGWVYTYVGTATDRTLFTADKSLPASTDGGMVAEFTGENAAGGFSTANTTQDWLSWAYCLAAWDGAYHVLLAGAEQTKNGASAGATPADSDKLRILRTGTSMTFEISTDGGGSWGLLHTQTGVTTAQLFPKSSLSEGGGELGPFLAVGLT